MKIPNTEREIRARNTGRLLALVYRCFTAEMHDRMAAAGLEGMRPAHSVVFEFLDAEGSRITDLAAQGQVTKQELVRLVNDLEGKGFLERTADPTDTRAKLVRLTEKGWNAMKLAEGIILQIEKDWEALLGVARKAQLVEALETLVEACSD